jgi:glycosidase
MTVLENYPAQVVHCNMNLLGTHDTPRILTALVDSFDGPREVLAERFLSPRQQKLAEMRLLVASFLQFTLPGAPSIYYGDEVTEEDAEGLLAKVEEQFPDLDVEMHSGGQPIYYYVMSVE